jgi:hypothetical protein
VGHERHERTAPGYGDALREPPAIEISASDSLHRLPNHLPGGILSPRQCHLGDARENMRTPLCGRPQGEENFLDGSELYTTVKTAFALP